MSATGSRESEGPERALRAGGRAKMRMHRVTRGARAPARAVPAENVVILRAGDFISKGWGLGKVSERKPSGEGKAWRE